MIVCTKLKRRLKNTSVYPKRLGRPIDEVSKVELSLFDRFMPMKNWIPSIIMTPIPIHQCPSESNSTDHLPRYSNANPRKNGPAVYQFLTGG
jgi:hypothetical protein